MVDEDREPEIDEFFYLWVLSAQTSDALIRARERDLARYDITNERRAVLFIIENNGGRVAPVQIARELFRELHSVTELLKRMEKAGLVMRHKGTGRSKVEVTLTDEGKRVLDVSQDSETEKRVFSALTRRERERLGCFLLKLRARVLEDLGIREWDLHLPANPYEKQG
jgi:DNA-binding MarR family transcriptional regulator